MNKVRRCPNPQALAWVEEHLDELLRLGWTECELFDHGRFKYPYGDWGLVFNSWPCEPELRDDGTIVFKIPDLRKGYVEQKIYPKIYFSKAS
ncbi:hypothetical protein JCM13304A_09380 [Desulfothermus okinawensis JCM 13304]